MKLIKGLLIGVSMSTALIACNNEKSAEGSEAETAITAGTTSEVQVTPGKYVNLNTGEEVFIIRDEATGYATDSIAKLPVDFYVNTSTNDTLYRTGLVVNHMLLEEDGIWKLDETKVKIDGDEIKIKDGDSKVKVDGEESKFKEGDYKKKVDGDDVKIKDGDSKTKIEDGEVKVKE